jgi:hypothetical protein
MPAASLSHIFNGRRVVANSRAEIIDITARGFNIRGFNLRGFNILECEFRHFPMPYRDFAVTEIRI